MLEAVDIHEHTYGCMHPKTFECYNSLVGLFTQDRVLDSAIKFQELVVIVAERLYGIDHAVTVRAWTNLALMEHDKGNHELCLKYFRHVIDLVEITGGRNHPESLSIDVCYFCLYFSTAVV